MKFTKRLTSLVIAIALVLTSLYMPVSVSAFSDVDENNPFSDAINELVAGGIVNGYEDGTFKPDNTITRAEFAKLLAVASAPTSQKFEATTTQFTDMPNMEAEQGWAIPYISYAVSTKAINGNPDGTFKPANPVTYGEAVKMIVCTLGYGPVVNTALVPWYQGYLDISKQIGLNKGAVANGDTPASRGLVAQLIYNMQRCAPLIQTGTDAFGNPTYSNQGTGTFEGNKDNATVTEGVVMGYTDYSLSGMSVGRSRVQIDSYLYSLGNIDLETVKSLIGHRVSFSYTETGNTPELVKLNALNGYNSITEIEPWQIDETTLSISGMEYFADEAAEKSDKATAVKFSTGFSVIYNGKPMLPADITDAFIKSYLDVDTGSIKLLSNDGSDSTAEVVFVEGYETYFVNSPSTSNGVTTIYDKNKAVTNLPDLAMEEDDVTSVTKVTAKDGKPATATLGSILNKNVVSVAKPYYSFEGTSVIISTATASGEIVELASDYEKIKIGSNYYELAPYYETLLADPNVGTSFELNLGDNVKFYLDHLGRIVFMEKNEQADPYGLLVAYSTGSGAIGSTAALKIMSASGKWLEYTMKDNIKINGTAQIDSANAINTLISACPDYDAGNPTFIIQPVIYRTSGTIVTAIETLSPAKAKAERLYQSSGYSFKEGTQSTDGTSFTMTTSGTNAAEVFVVPDDVTTYDKYYNRTASYFSNGSKYHVAAYEMNGTNAKVVVCYLRAGQTGGASVYAGTPVYVVEAISDTQVNGQAVKEIKYTPISTSGEQKTIKTNDEAAVVAKAASLQPGDLIKFITEEGAISDIKLVYTAAGLSNETGTEAIAGHHIIKAHNSDSDYYQVIYGTIYNCEEDAKQFQIIPDIYAGTALDESKLISLILGSEVKYLKYDTSSQRPQLVTTSLGEAKRYTDFKDTDPSVASKAVVIVIQDKVVGVYYVD